MAKISRLVAAVSPASLLIVAPASRLFGQWLRSSPATVAACHARYTYNRLQPTTSERYR
jgi:hypothetical protein